MQIPSYYLHGRVWPYGLDLRLWDLTSTQIDSAAVGKARESLSGVAEKLVSNGQKFPSILVTGMC